MNDPMNRTPLAVGTKVRVIKERPAMDKYYAYLWVDYMDQFLGAIGYVTKLHNKCYYVNISCDNSTCMWSPEWLEVL